MRDFPQPWIAWALALAATTFVAAEAQTPLGNRGVFQLHRADMPPGAVGQGQLLRGGPLAGYFQPVAIHIGAGARVAIWNGSEFQPLEGNPPFAGLQVGRVYRLQISKIAGHPGAELYPTVELVSRLFPPPGLALKYPVPVAIAVEEMEAALRGQFVTRVVYLENPDQALPVRDAATDQRVFEVGANEDPLQAADRLGRPMAIVRIGSRVPDRADLGAFGYGAPPFQPLVAPSKHAEQQGNSAALRARNTDRAVERSARVPRVPLQNSPRR